MNKKQVIKSIIECAKLYKDNLLDKSLLFIISNKHKYLSYFEVSFFKRNFLHLVGVDYKAGAEYFFDKCVSRNLSEDDFTIPESGTCRLKLEVLPSLLQKNLSANSIGNYNGDGIKLYSEKLVGSITGCLGFVVDKTTGLYLPNTAMKEDIRNISLAPQRRIISTFRKDITESFYEEQVYIAKKIKANEFKVSDEIKDKYGYLLSYIK